MAPEPTPSDALAEALARIGIAVPPPTGAEAAALRAPTVDEAPTLAGAGALALRIVMRVLRGYDALPIEAMSVADSRHIGSFARSIVEIARDAPAPATVRVELVREDVERAIANALVSA